VSGYQEATTVTGSYVHSSCRRGRLRPQLQTEDDSANRFLYNNPNCFTYTAERGRYVPTIRYVLVPV